MKKLFVITLAVIMLFGMSVNTLAACDVKCVEVEISAPVKAQAGETVTLTAKTLKHGPEFSDEWIGATKISTVLTEDGYYVSTARVTAQDSAAIKYNITMTTRNGVAFGGKASTAVEVEVEKTAVVIGAELKNISPVSFAPGFYTGELYVIYSNGTEKYNDQFIAFGQALKEIEVTFWENNIQYRYMVPVSI